MKNWSGTWALFRRECRRFLKVWVQTLGAPLVSALLYFAIFGGALGQRIGIIDGISFLVFLVPGLTAMGMLQHSYQNSSSSLIQMKYLGLIPADLLALPLTALQVTLAFMGASMVRGVAVGGLTLLVSRLFVPFGIAHPVLLVVSACLIAAIFGLLGVLMGILARTYDDISVVGHFLLTPLVYLGGVFFSITMLPEGWRLLVLANPVFYLVDLFRYALLGVSQGWPLWSLWISVLFLCVFFILTVQVLHRGWRIKN
ncbi:MAG: ABC transporter permease [Magnetococcus sp. DMHC-6]